MTSHFFLNLCAVIILSVCLIGNSIAATYIVQKNETLSQIASQSLPGEIWGSSGTLAQVLAMNPEIKNANLILPGQEIEIGSRAAVAEVSPKGKPHHPKKPIEETSTRIPASEDKPVAAEEVHHHLSLGLGYHFKTFSAQDVSNSSSAKLFTSSDLEFDVAWTQDWSEHYSSFFEFGFQKLDFQPSNNPNKSMVNTSQSPAHFTLGFDIRPNSRVTFRSSLGYGQSLFTGTQSQNISIDSVFIPTLSEEVVFNAYNAGRTQLGVQGGGSFLFQSSAGSYSINSGYAVNGGAFITQNFGLENKDSFTLFFGYESQNQNTSLVKQSTGDVFAKIIFSLPVFGAEIK